MTLFVVATLAVWRASLLITEEEGPFSLMARLRERIDPVQRTWVGRGFNCQWCVSWWAGAIAAVWLWYFGWIDVSLLPIWWFGMSGGSAGLSSLISWFGIRRR